MDSSCDILLLAKFKRLLLAFSSYISEAVKEGLCLVVSLYTVQWYLGDREKYCCLWKCRSGILSLGWLNFLDSDMCYTRMAVPVAASYQTQYANIYVVWWCTWSVKLLQTYSFRQRVEICTDFSSTQRGTSCMYWCVCDLYDWKQKIGTSGLWNKMHSIKYLRPE